MKTSQPVDPGRPLLRRTLLRHRRLLAHAVVLLCLWQACEAAVPVLIGTFVDLAVVTNSWPALAIGLVAVAALFTVLSLSYRFGARLANRALNVETHQLRVEVAGRALDPRGVRTSLMPGEILSVATADADVTSFVIRRIALTGAAVVGVLIGSVYLFLTDWVVGLVVLGGVALTLLAGHLIARPVERLTDTMQAKVASAAGQAADIMRGLRVIKGIGAEPAVRNRYNRASRDARDAAIRTAGGMAVTEATQQVLLGLLVAVVIGVSGLRLLDGHLTVGGLISVVGLAVFLAEPVSTVVVSIPLLFASLASARRIAEFTASPPLVADGSAVAPTGTAPTGTGVSVSGLPVPTDTDAGSRTVDLTVAPGELVAVVTDNPGVADALVAALAGESERADHVRIAGVPRTELSVATAHTAIAVVPHQVDLFEGTLRSNIELGTPANDPERLAAVLDAAACSELLELFPDRLDHPVDPDGSNLSGGQRQRIALARALLADPPVLVLSDPTTAVDAVTEQHIARSVRELRRHRATLVLTSSPAFCAAADRVVLLHADEHRTAEHADLLAASEGYRELVLR